MNNKDIFGQDSQGEQAQKPAKKLRFQSLSTIANPNTRVWSFGGGTQSLALLLLIKEGKLPAPEIAIMCDTGREKSATWENIEQYAKPLFAEFGIQFEVADHSLSSVDLWGGR